MSDTAYPNGRFLRDDQGVRPDWWDPIKYVESIEQARKAVEDTAFVIVSAKKRPDWGSHRPGVELIFYMAVIDYETKVMLHEVLESPKDRYVWEKYLALHLHEVLERAPQAIGAAIREMRRPGTASKADPERHEAAARDLREAFKEIRRDTEFMTAIESLRNGVAAHHMDKKSATMDPSIDWMLTAASTRARGQTPFTSQIVEYSGKALAAIQTFSHAVLTP
ncbi:hypothetical protein [Microbacterium imperiale]|uniref:hypothetical protein n=1 Tax=Microbacterium imperiale TaxID=33884 RepID=UPI001AE4E0CB|nr:hypothetical protein [Microbacterium imperiale]MBP2420740.1 hypothetical protein [Microbacterium imperiale]MDS0200639.1 hypothetical protein [Microbacterium imperiale]BFE41080.1 hypothetical protein GCM10017544_20360 [Microbacterium imperiale]